MSDEARNFRKSIRVGGVWIRAIGKNIELLVELEDGWHLCATEPLDAAFGHIVEPSGIINAPKDYLDTAPRPPQSLPAAAGQKQRESDQPEQALREALERILNGESEMDRRCHCECDDENCCEMVGEYCPWCIARAALCRTASKEPR